MGDEPYMPERRPLASRERRLSKAAAHWLAVRGASPNAISLAGMVAGVAAGTALVATSYSLSGRLAFVAAALLIQLRLLANMLDGMVALETGKASPTGELFNEVPDRVSDAAMFIGAGYAAGGSPTLGYVAACLAVFLAYVRAQGKVAGAHQEFCGPMAKPQRAFTMTVVSLCCALLPTDWHTKAALGPSRGILAWALAAVIAGEVWTAARRLRRIAGRLRELPREE
jgi:phosphatidylglycerophosphate synthase